MAYDQGYRQPQEYAPHPDQKGTSMQQGRGMPQFVSHQGSMNVGYRSGGVGGHGDRVQTQRLRHPPPSPMNTETAFLSFPDSNKRSIPVPPGSLPIDDSMLAMNLEDGGGSRPTPRQRGPPPGPHGLIPRAQIVQPDRMRGRPPPSFARGGEQGGYPPHEELGSQGQRGPPPHQRLPPPRGDMPRLIPNGRGFPPGPGRPPVRQNTMGGYDQGRNGRYQNQYNNEYMGGRGHPQPDPGYGPPQRSMTMPSYVQYQNPTQHQALNYPQQQQSPPPQPAQPQKQQYTAYNPTHHGTIVNYSAPRTAGYPQTQALSEEGYDRESVGALLDSYYQEAGVMDDYGDQSGYPENPYQNSQNGYAHNPNFAQQAHRARSQPDLRGQAREGSAPPMPMNGYSNMTNDNNYQNREHYDRARGLPVEMPAEIPAEMPGGLPPDEPIVMTANGFPPPPPQSNIPMALRVCSPAPAQNIRQTPPSQPPPQQQQDALLPRAGSTEASAPSVSPDSLPYHPSPDSLPYHPSPSSHSYHSSPASLPYHPPPAPTRFSSDSGRLSHPDSLPAHQVPVRPGLLQQDQSSVLPGHLSGHPPPRRQYSPDRNSANSRQGSVPPGPITPFELNQIQQAARANPGDNKLQLQLAKKMVEAASALANEGGRADARTTRKNRENYILDAYKIVKKLASSSHPYPDAMFYLAECYWEGLLGLQIDRERAFNLYQSAAKLNHAPSAYRTAVCCELGAGTRKDPLKSMTWYKKASALGDTAAMYKLGMIMLKGLLGQARNGREAINWLKRAADQADENNPHALHQLGLIYEQADPNDFVIPDQNYARELFLKAAELGYPPSQFRMGCAFEYGTTGCPIDPMQSIAWYSRAAVQGEEESAMALSGWYLTGAEGVIQQSDTEAYLWARKAAERGLANAEYALGYFTEVGIGVANNLDEAKMWYFKAASQQHEKAQQRLQELKRGGAAAQKSRERLSRSNVKGKDDGECIIISIFTIVFLRIFTVVFSFCPL